MRLPIAVLAACALPAQTPLKVLIVDGVNNHDWQAATRMTRTILEGTGRFQVDVATWPQRPVFTGYAAVVNNFNGGHTEAGLRWPADLERSLVEYVRGGGGLVNLHAANNGFPHWREFNEMIGLGWREPAFGPGLAVRGDQVVTLPAGTGLRPGHGPRQDFEIFTLDATHPMTRGLPGQWRHASEQLTHGQHGPAVGLQVLTYAFSEVSHSGEPMDWVRAYGKGRVYTTMLGHTWKNELNPNYGDIHFQTLLARGVEWAATGDTTLPVGLGWRPLFNGRDLEGWEVRGDGSWTVTDGLLHGQRVQARPESPFTAPWPVGPKEFAAWLYRQAWLYTKAEFTEYDLHLEYWVPPGGNSGISIRDRSRAHHAIGEEDSARPDLAAFPKTTPAHIGYEIQLTDDDGDKYPSGSIYTFVAARAGVQRRGAWNALEVESRRGMIRVRLNGEPVAEFAGDPARSRSGPVGLQLHDQFSAMRFRSIRIRERST